MAQLLRRLSGRPAKPSPAVGAAAAAAAGDNKPLPNVACDCEVGQAILGLLAHAVGL
jgi:hypothetical protein